MRIISEWGAIWGHQPSSGGGGYGGRRGPDPEIERRQREEDERARFDKELAVRGHLDDGRGGALPVVNTAELDAEEGVVRTRIVAVEERIQTILQNPLGEDGLGRKKVWRVRPGNKIWSDTLGDKRATEVLKDSATGMASGATWALRGTAQAVSTGASRVVTWSYKPALWSAAELAGDTVSVAAKGAYSAASAIVGGIYSGANTVSLSLSLSLSR